MLKDIKRDSNDREFNIDGIAIVVAGYYWLILTSGVVVNVSLNMASKESIKQMISKDVLDTGFIVGKCENILVITFILLNAYTALAILFAAKTIVRKEDISSNSLYYLAGTMANVTYSVLVGLVIKILILM